MKKRATQMLLKTFFGNWRGKRLLCDEFVSVQFVNLPGIFAARMFLHQLLFESCYREPTPVQWLKTTCTVPRACAYWLVWLGLDSGCVWVPGLSLTLWDWLVVLCVIHGHGQCRSRHTWSRKHISSVCSYRDGSKSEQKVKRGEVYFTHRAVARV